MSARKDADGPPASEPPRAPPPAGALTEEAGLIRAALEQLRRAHAPAAALTLLDARDARFPGGALRLDAELVRVMALLALGREAEALSVLARDDLRDGPRRDELDVLRGELLAARDCRAAIAAFDGVLGRVAPSALAERALRARAVCRLRLGDRVAGAADLRAYLDRFPEGPLAPEARRRLGALARERQ